MAWEAYDGQTRRLEIYDLQAEQAVAVPIALTPAVTPFVSEVSSEDEAMQTVLTGSAKMTFIGNWQTLSGIDLTSSVRYRAILKDTADTILWLGFLKADVNDQAYDQTATEITLNLIDDIEALDAFRIDTDVSELPTMGELLAECFGKIYGWADYNLHFTYDQEFDTPTILGLKIARQNFIDVDDDGNVQGDTCREFVEAFCTLYGFTLHQQGCDMYFDRSYAGNTQTYMIDFGEDGSLVMTEDFTRKDAASFQDINSRGADNSVNVSQGLKSITLKPEINDVPDVSIELSPKGAEILPGGGTLTWQSYKVNSERQQGNWFAIPFKPKHGDCVVNRWTGSIWNEAPYESRKLFEIMTCKHAGCMCVYDDYWCAADFDKGSAETNDAKKKLSYSVRAYISPAVVDDEGYPYHHRPPVKPMLTLESENEVMLTEGAIEISMSPHFYDEPNGGWEISKRNGQPQKNGGDKEEYEESWEYHGGVLKQLHRKLVCRLSIGDKYWDGTTWVEDPTTTFTPHIENQTAHSTTKLQSNVRYYQYVDAENYIALIMQPLSGKVKFEIVDAYNGEVCLKSLTHDDITEAPIVIENLSIKYAKKLKEPVYKRPGEILETEEKSRKYVRYGTDAVRDDKSISLKMHTIVEGQTALSNILGTDGKPVTSILIDGTHIEDALADRMKGEAISPRTFLCIGATHGDVAELSNVQLDGGNYATICTKQTDWRTLQSKIHLIKL